MVRNRTGEILLVKRTDQTWWIPGGRVELGETFAEAAVREVAEGTGIAVRFAGVLAVTESTLLDRHVVLVTCLADLLGGEIRIPIDDPKVTDVRWVQSAQAEELLPDFPARPVILRLDPPRIPHFVERPTRI